ncbi:MAG: hypothetical protein HOP30_18710 [Cyclobacteriaceae bacterium]|nr:hypothetical protein [Cyclobacteriaceae bacterium]
MMQLDLKLKDVIPTFVLIHRDLTQTSALFKKRLDEYTARNERYQEATKKLGWREKYLDGFLGGDKALVAKLENEFVELTNFRKSLLELEKKVKSIEESILSEIIRFLSKESPEYISYESLLQHHLIIADESARFYNSLAEVKRKISDALVFTTWSNLLNHSKAAVLLQEFYDQVKLYNQKVVKYQLHMKCNLLEATLIETIDLSSQSSAMESLNGLLIKSEEILNFANEQINVIAKKRGGMIDHVKWLVSQNKN